MHYLMPNLDFIHETFQNSPQMSDAAQSNLFSPITQISYSRHHPTNLNCKNGAFGNRTSCYTLQILRPSACFVTSFAVKNAEQTEELKNSQEFRCAIRRCCLTKFACIVREQIARK